jgi:DNA-binding NtrC family response regulator
MSFRAMWVFRGGHPAFRDRLLIPEDRRAVVGRGSSCDLQLKGPAVSKRHLEIWSEHGQVFAEDLGSRNGTFLVSAEGEDGQRLVGPVRVRPRQGLRVAEFLLLPEESLGTGVGVVDEALAAGAGALSGLSTWPPAPGAAPADVDAAVFGLGRALDGISGTADAFGAVLRCIGELVGAEDAFLITRQGDRLALRAHLHEDRPFTLSRRFVEHVLQAKGPCVLRLEDAMSEISSPPSLVGLSTETVLFGLGLSSSADGTESLFCAYGTRVPDDATLRGLERVAPIAGAVVELQRARDRESRRREAVERAAGLQEAPAPCTGADRLPVSMVGTSPRFRWAVEAAAQAAATPVTVLVRGPSGSGKDLIARLVHEASPRREQPFVIRNCAAIPAELVESELFGHDRGAFTGATEDRLGAFQRADGGTLFLDEIGDLAPAAQAKVLRAVETGEIVRVGGSMRRVDVRLVAASQRDLEAMVEAGTFRVDLYYRLRVVEIRLPSLRDRPEDIIPLAEHFLRGFAAQGGRDVSGLSLGAAKVLTGYHWPGNVRELRNVIERAVVLDSDGVIDADDLPLDVREDDPADAGAAVEESEEVLDLPWREAKRRFSARYFQRALERHGGRVQETARATGISRRSLSNLIRSLRLRRE